MKICVQGLWHLGVVTSAALTSLDFKVIALDYDESTIKNLKSNVLPVEEPGVLDLLIKANYKLEAILKEHCFFKNRFIDVVLHSKINKHE